MKYNRCPTCVSSGDYSTKYASDRHCAECGTWWSTEGEYPPVVPRRSQPPEVKTLPDAEGWWWFWRENVKAWEPGNVEILNGAPYWKDDECCPDGRYVLAVPPPPPEERDEDAGVMMMRKLADYYFETVRRNKQSVHDDIAESLRRIAERLEREAGGK